MQFCLNAILLHISGCIDLKQRPIDKASLKNILAAGFPAVWALNRARTITDFCNRLILLS